MGRRVGVALAILLTYYLAIHFLFLNGKPFFGDEVYFGRVARDIAGFGFPRPDLLAHPPAFSHVLAASFGLFGFSEWVARLVPTTFGLLSLVLVYKVGESVYSREAGVLAVFMLVISKTFLSYTTLVDIDGSAVAFFLLLETHLIFQYLKRPGNSLVPAAAVLGAGLLFKLGTVIVPFAVLLFMERKRVFSTLSGILLGIGIFLAAYTAYFAKYPWGFWTGFLRPLSHFFGTAGGVREPLLKFLGVLFWNASFPLVLLLGYSLLRAVRYEDDKKAKFLALCALLIVLTYSLVSHKMERYFVPAMPLAAILAAGYVLPALKERLPMGGASALLGLAYFSLLGTYSLSPPNVALSLLPLAAAFIFLRDGGAETTLLAVVFGLYVGTSVFATAVYATHDYVINECDGQREAASFIAKNLEDGRVAYTDATVGFYLGGLDYSNPVSDLEGGIRSGRIRYYSQCKAWPNFSEKNPLDLVAGKYESRSFYVKSIKIREFP